MKIPISIEEKQKFIDGADNGNPLTVSNQKRKGGISTFNFTSNQWNVISDVLDKSNFNLFNLLFVSIHYYKKNKINYNFYNNFLTLLSDKGNNNKRVTYKKEGINDELKNLSALLKKEWIAIPLKGVALLLILNYAKNELSIDINKYLEE